MRDFDQLTEREILALAIFAEEEDGRIYRDFAEGLRADYPYSSNVFTAMAAEEDVHRRWLIDLYRQKFGEHIPLIRREDVRGFFQRKPVWQLQPIEPRRGAPSEPQEMEIRRGTVLPARRRTLGRRLDPQAAGRPRRAPRPGTSSASPSASWRKTFTENARRRGEHERPAHASAALHPAGSGRTDGRLGVHAGAGIRRRLRHRQFLGRLPGRHGRLARRRHFDGVRRGAVRQRQPHRPWRAAAARGHLRRDDHARRHRPYLALPDPRLPHRPQLAVWW